MPIDEHDQLRADDDGMPSIEVRPTRARTVYKYPLSLVKAQAIDMPRGAVIRAVATQGSAICLWAEVDPGEPMEQHSFSIFGTGHPIPTSEPPVLIEYVGTAFMGAYVWHVYEIYVEVG